MNFIKLIYQSLYTEKIGRKERKSLNNDLTASLTLLPRT